jgi:hypothetical protein
VARLTAGASRPAPIRRRRPLLGRPPVQRPFPNAPNSASRQPWRTHTPPLTPPPPCPRPAPPARCTAAHPPYPRPATRRPGPHPPQDKTTPPKTTPKTHTPHLVPVERRQGAAPHHRNRVPGKLVEGEEVAHLWRWIDWGRVLLGVLGLGLSLGGETCTRRGGRAPLGKGWGRLGRC